MYFTTTVKLVLQEAPSEGIPGVRLCLYDRDRITRDDLLGSETTDDNGEACFRFDSDRFVDLDDRLGGVFPELYVAVCDERDEKVFDTRSDCTHNSAPRHMTVCVPRMVAEEHGLLVGAQT
ncbi:MAG: transthyretin-like family protein [Gemmatimonadota bacterium]|jgi:hypothetical protein|nr:transthyretin-like family protein [Gemmatimonadota bacterium]